MSDDKKYYYLKLKESFFDNDEMIILESMQDGYLYSNILLKLYLRSVSHNGRLMFKDRIPFNSSMLAQVTRHSVGTVEKAVRIFKDLDLIEVLDNGAIYMLDIQNFIGQSSTEADRKREYRRNIEQEKQLLVGAEQMSDKCPDKNPPELEIEIELEKELEIKIDKEAAPKKSKPKPVRHKYGSYENVLLDDVSHQKLLEEFPNDWQDRIERLSEYMASTGKSYKNHLATIRNWAKRDGQQGEQGFNAKVKPSEQLRDWDQYQPPVDQGRQAELDRKMAQFLEEDF